MATKHAEKEFEKFEIQRQKLADAHSNTDFDLFSKQLERKITKKKR